MYEYVRRVNEGINKLKKYASFGQADEERLEAEMRFFRGYLYTDLLKRYKEVIIYDENLDNIKRICQLVRKPTDGILYIMI